MHVRTRDGRRENGPGHARMAMVLALALTFGMIAVGPVAAQTLVNGNFEGSPQTNPYALIFAPNFIDATHSWKVASGSVDVGTGPGGTRCTTADGHCVDLNGDRRGKIQQTMASTPGTRCTVTFMMSRHVSLAASSATLRTFINNVSTSPATFTHSVPGVTVTDGRWQSNSFSFVTVGATTTLAFESTREGAAGPQVDDVSMTCIASINTGSLSVHKTVVNNTGGPAPIPATFSTTTHCSANSATLGVDTPVAVAGSQTVTLPAQINAGITCSVTETLPPLIPHLEACKGQDATWTMSYSAPVTITAGATSLLTVTNTLTCNKPTGGTLQIHKSVINTLGMPTPTSFNMTATCSGMTPMPVTVAVDGTVTVPPAGQIPDGTVCTITETIPPQLTGVRGCPSGTAMWVPSNPGPLTIHTAQTSGTIITNTLTCDKPPAGGHLTVNKVVSNLTGGPAPIPPTFPVVAHCTLSGVNTLNVTLPVPAGSGVSAVPAITTGSICTITEGALPSIPNLKACNGRAASWTSSFSGPVTMGTGVSTLTATNTLRCDPPSGGDCPNPTLSTIGCRITVTIKRSKGPAIYSVTVSTPATTPTPNILPSTSAKCEIAGGAMINQTTCWFNYNTNPTPVTLTAISSTGTLPAGFTWSGSCLGTSMTCQLNADPTPKNVVANFP